MSNDIRKYRSIKGEFDEADDLKLTAFVGGEKHGKCIQFTIGNRYTCLSEKQLLDLLDVIIKRLALKPGFCATDYCEEKLVFPDGTKIPETIMSTE